MNDAHATTEAAIEAIRCGKFVIVVDDEDRENEGDLLCAAETITEEQMSLLIRHTSGIIFLALSPTIANALDLPPMVAHNTSKRGTPFTVSIEAAKGVDTGVSARDRTTTIRTAIHPNAKPTDLHRPGHIFPLRAQQGGVLVRAGHTEASVDLCALAGIREGAVGAELMNDDGTMMRMPELQSFSTKHSIPLITVKDIIAYRRTKESLVMFAAKSILETTYGTFELSVFTDTQNREHLAMTMGKIDGKKPTLVRVHSECITGDVLHSLHCDCGEQLDLALKKIAHEGVGALVYLRQEGRGIGLTNKIKAYGLQHLGLDTVEANEKLGLAPDLREYGIGAQILKSLGIEKMRLLTNNPKKVIGLEGFALEIVEQLPLEIEPQSEKQKKYLRTKKEKLNHHLKKV